MRTYLCLAHWHGPQSIKRCMLPADGHTHDVEPCNVPTCRDRQDPAPR